MPDLVLDASALVDLLVGNELGRKVRDRLSGSGLHAPGHADAEVLSALGRLHRAGELAAEDVDRMLGILVAAPIHRHPVDGLVLGAWARRAQLRLADAVYVELAARLGLPLLTTDRRLHAVPEVEVVRP